jgi:hypothetical protein
MADWVTPKTDWKADDYFNLDPDYNRIKGNIQWIKDFSAKMYDDFPMLSMGDFTVDGFPADTFLNNIVDNVKKLEDNLYRPPGDQTMQRYALGGPGWDYQQLNVIEENIRRLHDAMVGQWSCLFNMPMPFGLGTDEF